MCKEVFLITLTAGLSCANHTSNTGNILNQLKAEATNKTVDIIVVHPITNRIEKNAL